ncbi:MAG: YceI family protein [Polyangiales bacterium]
MRTTALLFVMGLMVMGCKNPGADVTPATVEATSDTKADPAKGGEPSTSNSLAINPSNSKVEFVGAKVTASHPGGFSDFAGTVSVGDPIETSKIDMTIQTASLFADKEKLTKHLKSPDFFDVERFPTATFRSTGIRKSAEGYIISGDLTLHGVTLGISFPATINATPTEISANAEFSINRQAFAISYPGMKDDLIRDLVVIKLSMKLPR